MQNEEGFDRGEKYKPKIKLDLENANKNSQTKIVIVSDIGISSSQTRTRLRETKIDLSKYKEIIFLNCIYTDVYKKKLQSNLKGLNLKFEGTEVKSSEYMYGKVINKKYKDTLQKEFFIKDEILLNKKMPHNESMKYREYIEQIEEDRTENILIARYKSMPKAHIIGFDDTVFKYRKDK